MIAVGMTLSDGVHSYRVGELIEVTSMNSDLTHVEFIDTFGYFRVLNIKFA